MLFGLAMHPPQWVAPQQDTSERAPTGHRPPPVCNQPTNHPASHGPRHPRQPPTHPNTLSFRDHMQHMLLPRQPPTNQGRETTESVQQLPRPRRCPRPRPGTWGSSQWPQWPRSHPVVDTPGPTRVSRSRCLTLIESLTVCTIWVPGSVNRREGGTWGGAQGAR